MSQGYLGAPSVLEIDVDLQVNTECHVGPEVQLTFAVCVLGGGIVIRLLRNIRKSRANLYCLGHVQCCTDRQVPSRICNCSFVPVQ